MEKPPNRPEPAATEPAGAGSEEAASKAAEEEAAKAAESAGTAEG